MPGSPTAGGCSFAEDPGVAFDRARIIWSAAIDPGVLPVTTRRADRHPFDLRRYRHDVVVDGAGREHVAISIGSTLLRLDVEHGSLLHGPVGLDVRLRCDREITRALPALDWLLGLVGIGHGARRPMPVDRRLPRLITALRVADALAARASLAQIARALSSTPDRAIDWPGDGDYLKSRTRRLVTLARRLMAGGPAAVLAHRI